MSIPVRAATVEITPRHGLPLAGYANRLGKSTGVLSPLEANAVAFGDQLVVISLDSLSVSPEMRSAVCDALASGGLAGPEHVIVVASHTHAAPSSWVGTIHPSLPAELDIEECARVAQLLATSLATAPIESCNTVQLGFATVDGVGLNRHSPEGPVDPSLSTVAIKTDDDRTIAVFLSYACHPTVLGPENHLYSPDWVGAARESIRLHEGFPLPTVYLPGSGGDVSTRFSRHASTVSEVERLGALVGASAINALGSAVDHPLNISLARKVFSERTRTGFSDIGIPENLDADTSGRLSASIQEGIAARHAFTSGQVPEALDIPVSYVTIGPQGFIFVPFEVGAEIASRVSQTYRLVGYADAYCGYLVTRSEAEQGHYEALASLFDIETTERIVVQLGDASGARCVTASS